MKLQDITVLVVDDSEPTRTLLVMMLRKAGVKEVFVAGNGLEGFTHFQHHHPTIVFLDNMMPVMSGLETLKKIMELDPEATVVMISALSSMDVIRDAKNLGASHYIVKPYSSEKVISTITKLLKLEA